MADCKYIKSLQFYLDGYARDEAARELEEHLKSCSHCQIEMAELVEVNNAALEIADQAPGRDYWNSFATRVRNRIIARSVEPMESVNKPASRFPLARLATVLTTLVIIMGTMFLVFRYPVQKAVPTAAISPGLNSNELHQDSSNPSRTVQTQPPSNLTTGGNNHPLSLPDASKINPTETSAKTFGNLVPRPKAGNGIDVLALKDPGIQFRASSFSENRIHRLTNEPDLSAPISQTDNAAPAFRLKNTFVGQRILASLGTNAQDAPGAVNKGPLYGYNVTALTGTGNDPGASSTWGYLRIASDTSRSSEVKRYFIELEIMQAK